MMKFKNNLKVLGYSVAGALGFAAATSQAAVDASITTAITTAATDGATVAVGVLLVFVGIKAVKWLRGAL